MTATTHPTAGVRLTFSDTPPLRSATQETETPDLESNDGAIYEQYHGLGMHQTIDVNTQVVWGICQVGILSVGINFAKICCPYRGMRFLALFGV